MAERHGPGRKANASSPLALVPAIQEDLAAMAPPLLQGIAEGFDSAEQAVETLRSILAQFEQVARPPEWGQFWSHDTARDRYVGLAGFKAPPHQDEVEIAYFTFPGFEGRGFATATIRRLVDRAAAAVKRVVAHTLAQDGASTRALQRCGFACAGDVFDPEDGTVWRWVRTRA